MEVSQLRDASLLLGNTPGPIARNTGVDPDNSIGEDVSHSLGLTNYEPPWGSRAWPGRHSHPIRKGQVFDIETQDSVGDGQGYRVEEVATKDGCEVLSLCSPLPLPKFTLDEDTFS